MDALERLSGLIEMHRPWGSGAHVSRPAVVATELAACDTFLAIHKWKMGDLQWSVLRWEICCATTYLAGELVSSHETLEGATASYMSAISKDRTHAPLQR